MTLAEAIAEVTESPLFPSVVDELKHRLRDERAARKRFAANASEDAREEFISGKVVTQMPARREHGRSLKWISQGADNFIRLGVGGEVQTEQAIIRGIRNDYVPDFCYWPKSQSKSFAKRQTIYPPPAWIIEFLSPDTAARDRGVKFIEYAQLGVAEYWLVDVDEEFIEQYRNVRGRFELVKNHANGTIRGIAIKSFAMPVRAAFEEAASGRYLKKLWTRK